MVEDSHAMFEQSVTLARPVVGRSEVVDSEGLPHRA